MKVNQEFIERFNQLIEFSSKIEAESKSIEWRGHVVDDKQSSQFGLKVLNLIKQTCGTSSDYYIKFGKEFNNFPSHRNFINSLGILEAAKDDYENSYLFDTRAIIEAEVFDEFLEQAEELFKKNYYQAAAVIAGCVLEDGLRKLGQRKIPNFPTDKTIDPMNVELAKAGIYNALWQKKIITLADLRNKAAHGKWTEFTKKDVEDMIRDMRRFMEDYFR
jgi:hypothetical protein